MAPKITLEQHIEELRAELSASTDTKERAGIVRDLSLCLNRLMAIEWTDQQQMPPPH